MQFDGRDIPPWLTLLVSTFMAFIGVIDVMLFFTVKPAFGLVFQDEFEMS